MKITDLHLCILLDLKIIDLHLCFLLVLKIIDRNSCFLLDLKIVFLNLYFLLEARCSSLESLPKLHLHTCTQAKCTGHAFHRILLVTLLEMVYVEVQVLVCKCGK